MWTVRFTDEAFQEYQALPDRERAAMAEAINKLKAIGPNLGAPHSSRVQGVKATIRELRPRRGSSPWRAFYRRVGDQFVIASVGPEAEQNNRGFQRAVDRAIARLSEIEV